MLLIMTDRKTDNNFANRIYNDVDDDDGNVDNVSHWDRFIEAGQVKSFIGEC